jgi:hypothetical protein
MKDRIQLLGVKSVVMDTKGTVRGISGSFKAKDLRLGKVELRK